MLLLLVFETFSQNAAVLQVFEWKFTSLVLFLLFLVAFAWLSIVNNAADHTRPSWIHVHVPR